MNLVTYTFLVAILSIVAFTGSILWIICFSATQESGERPGKLALCFSFLLFLVWPVSFLVLWLWSAIVLGLESLKRSE